MGVRCCRLLHYLRVACPRPCCLARYVHHGAEGLFWVSDFDPPFRSCFANLRLQRRSYRIRRFPLRQITQTTWLTSLLRTLLPKCESRPGPNVLATMLIHNRSPYLGLPVMVGVPAGPRGAAPANGCVDCLCVHDKSAPNHVDDGIRQQQPAPGECGVGAVKE